MKTTIAALKKAGYTVEDGGASVALARNGVKLGIHSTEENAWAAAERHAAHYRITVTEPVMPRAWTRAASWVAK